MTTTTSLPGWTPLQPAEFLPATPEQVQKMAEVTGHTSAEVHEMLARERATSRVFRNDLYQVTRRALNEDGLVHLNIRRIDGRACHDWRHFQQIKNELIGEECEAVELYPAESRLVDTSNKYHLVGIADPAFRFPTGDFFGNKRDVSYVPGGTPGTRQRPLGEEI